MNLNDIMQLFTEQKLIVYMQINTIYNYNIQLFTKCKCVTANIKASANDMYTRGLLTTQSTNPVSSAIYFYDISQSLTI